MKKPLRKKRGDGAVPKSMFYRRKVLLSILQAWGGRLPGPDLQHILFLFSQRQSKPAYSFVPSRSGCMSRQALADKSAMAFYGQLKDAEEWVKADAADYLGQLNPEDKRELSALKESLGGLHGEDLERRVYREYPYYAIKSGTAGRILSKGELERVREAAPKDASTVLFTIGYEGLSIDQFLDRLVGNGIRELCDVRKNPLSMKQGFSKSQLKAALSELGILYRHIPGLGIESEKRKNLSSEREYVALFDDYERTTLKAGGDLIDDIIATLDAEKRIALMCFERDPVLCHRGRLAKAIEKHPRFRHRLIHIGIGEGIQGPDP